MLALSSILGSCEWEILRKEVILQVRGKKDIISLLGGVLKH